MAIIALTALEIVALCVGVDGQAFTSVTAAIAGLGGWMIHKAKTKT